MTSSSSAHGTSHDAPDDWRTRAACLDVDPERMFPDSKDHPANLLALSVCAGCDVRPECLEEALDSDSRYGVWGGTTELERRVMQTGRRTRSLNAWPPRVQHGTTNGFEAHRRRGQEPCESCREGENAYRAEVKAARRQRLAERQEVAS